MALVDRINRFWRDRRGNFAMMLAVAAVPLLGAVGLAADFATLSTMKAKLQNANDAAVLFASRYYEEKRQLPRNSDVQDFLAVNYSMTTGAANLYVKDNQIWLETDSDYQPYFMSVFSSRVEKVSAKSATPLSKEIDMEIVLALDTTGSMANDGKIEGLKTAASNFVGSIFNAATDHTRIKIGLTPFARYVNVGLQNRSAAWMSVPPDQSGNKWEGCVGLRSDPLASGARLNLVDQRPEIPFPGIMGISCSTSIAPLTDDRQALLDQIAAFKAVGSTYIVDGVMWGQRVLSPQLPFAEGVDPKKVSHEVRKIMVLMTDGENTVSADWPQYPTHNGSDRALTDNWTRKACREAADSGTEIFTITFGKDVPKSAKTIMEKCAASEDHYFDAASSANLDDAFGAIASYLTRIRLTH